MPAKSKPNAKRTPPSDKRAVRAPSSSGHIPAAQLPAEGFVRLPVVLAHFPVKKSTWWNGVKDGRFPQPVKLGPRMTAWKVEDIRALIARAGVAANDAAA